jgi:hypothetical protein
LIQNLLDLPPGQQHQQVQAGSGAKRAEDYIEILHATARFNKEHKFLKCQATFQITDLPADPEALLYGVFQYCVDAAIADSRERGYPPDHLGCMISSTLLDPDIYVGIRPINENTVDAILNRFMDIAQSLKAKGITLWGSPFSVTVTTVQRSGLPVRNSKRSIVGGGAALAPVHHQIKRASLLQVGYFSCLDYGILGMDGFGRRIIQKSLDKD